MARLLVKQLMISLFTLKLQVTSADMVSVHLGEIITLSCNTTNAVNILWYRLQSEELKLIISARQAKLGNSFSSSFNVDEGHYDVTENRSLVINGFGDTDLGAYYCAGQNATRILFGKPITLKFADNPNQEAVQVSSADVKLDRCQSLNIILMCVCSVSFLMNIICICVFSFQVKGKCSASLTCCSDSNTTYTPEKEINLHYATLTQQRHSAGRNPSDPDRVTYAGIRHSPS